MNNELTQEELEYEIMELEDRLAYKKEQYKRLKLTNENGRYFLNEGGDILELIPTVNDESWGKAVKQNNTFKTRKDAEKERDRRELLYEFNQFKNERNNGWAPDWKNLNMSKYFVAVDSDGYLKSMSMYVTDTFVQFGYFHNYEDCMDAIEKFGDRIRKLYID